MDPHGYMNFGLLENMLVRSLHLHHLGQGVAEEVGAEQGLVVALGGGEVSVLPGRLPLHTLH